MNKRGTGTIFCLIGTMLEAARYIAAAIFMSGVASWDAGLFACGLEYVGDYLSILSIIALTVGIIYLVSGEIEEWKKRKSQRKDGQ